MNEGKVLKHAAVYSVILMILVVIFSIRMRYPKESVSYASEITKVPIQTISLTQPPKVTVTPMEVIHHGVYSNLPYGIEQGLLERLGNNFIAIEKPKELSKAYNVTLEDLAVDRRIHVTLTGIQEESIDFSKIHRIYQGNYKDGQPVILEPSPTLIAEPEGEEVNLSPSDIKAPIPTDSITSLQVVKIEDQITQDKSVIITFDLIKTYAYLLEEDDHYFYIALVRPQDVYDKIIVLDAGHGGQDSGTYSNGYDYLEKTMNLDMLLRLQEYFLEHKSIKIYTTRITDRRLTLNQRVNLANDVEADLFLSIHCNANVESSINGTEVLYNEKQNGWTGFNSKQFAKICQEELVAKIGLKDRGIVPRSKNVYIVGEASMPVALVEVGFMSNLTDLDFLTKEANRQLVAEGIYQGIIRSLESMDKTSE